LRISSNDEREQNNGNSTTQMSDSTLQEEPTQPAIESKATTHKQLTETDFIKVGDFL